MYPRCTWPGSQSRRPAPQRADASALACLRYTPGISPVSRRVETSAGVRKLKPCRHAPAAPPPAPPRREVRNELKPPAAFRITAGRPQLRRPRPGAVGHLDPHDAVPGTDRDRDRLPRSARAAVPDRIAEGLADEQDGHVCAGVPRAEYLGDEGAGGPRPLYPPGKRHALPDRPPSHHRTRLPRPPRPGETGRVAGGRGDMHAQLRRERQAGTTGLRGPLSVARPWSRPPSVAVRAKPTVPRTAPSPRFSSAMRPWMAQQPGSQRDKVTHAGTEKKRPASARYRS